MEVLIVDDHQLIRSAVSNLLSREFDNLQCTEADSGEAAFEQFKRQDFDCAIVDLFLQGEPPFVFLRNLCDRYPELPVVVLSASDNQSHMRKCIDLGASAFINKGEAMENVIDAVKTVIGRGLFIQPALQQPATREIHKPDSLPDISLDEVINRLTDRQLDILSLVAQGKSNKEVARERDLSDNTIKVHVSAILRALGLNNRTQLGLLAQKVGIIDNP